MPDAVTAPYTAAVLIVAAILALLALLSLAARRSDGRRMYHGAVLLGIAAGVFVVLGTV